MIAALGIAGSTTSGLAADIVNDTWRDGTRTDPTQPTYSENGTDADADGNLEALWYNAAGTMTVINATPGVTPGTLRTTVPTGGSASWTTYFTPEASPVTLVNAGDKITVTWVFTPTAAVSTDAGNQNMRIAIVDSPAAARRTTDGAPGSAAYRGYGIYGNFAQTLGSSPLRLMERANPSGNFLSTGAEFSQRAAAGTTGNAGYAQGSTYTLVFSATRTAAGYLDITATISGGTIDNTGSVTVNYVDDTPDTFTFDTFGMRPQTGALTSEQFDTSLFKVEKTAGCPPGTLFAVTGGGAYCSGGSGVSVGLAGSQINVDYQLRLGNTDVGSPIPGNGAALDFGLQTAAGTYTVQGSNTVTACVGAMTGNAVVTINEAPGIGTQPLAQNAPLGGSASFTVVATGAGLSYQWRRDGTNLVAGGNIANVNLPTLTINPVALVDGVPDVNGYDVVVSGTCSPAAISDRVALNVSIPKNLTWAGGLNANAWDTTTANWTGEATVFTGNDNVTFNNSGSATPAVDLVGVISPNNIVVNATQDYTIGTTTSGTLGGNASLAKSGTGKLTLTTDNTFTGKTTVTGGTLSITTAAQLGTSPVVFVADQLLLNGGALEVLSTGGLTANRGTTLGASGGKLDIPASVDFTLTPVTTGPGSLTKIGDGTLLLTVANTYAGGTVISNGTVSVGNASALGSGTVTLAGGTLHFPGATTIANSVQVVADSTLTFANTGNSAVVLNGTSISGTANQTLTITPTGASTAGTRIRINNGLTNSFTFNPNIVLNGTFTFATYNNVGNQTYNGVISGSGILGRRSPLASVAGNTILNGDNTYSGGTVIADGGIGFGINSTGLPVTSGPIGTGALSVENNPGTLHRLFASGGARTVGNNMTWPLGTNQALIIEGANALTLAGDMDLGAATRTITTSNSANSILSGNLSNGGIAKDGPGTLLLNGTATLTDLTVNAGTLGGTGTITGPVTVAATGNLSPGTSIGTLTISGDLTLGGNTLIEVNKTANTKDLITGVATLNYGGTLTVVNESGTLQAGDSFVIASATTPVGNFASIVGSPGAGLAWSFNPATGTLAVVANVGQPTLNVSQAGNTLTFSWAGAFKLQSQTNTLAVGIAANWGDYPGGGTSPVNVTINPANGSVFFRLINQ